MSDSEIRNSRERTEDWIRGYNALLGQRRMFRKDRTDMPRLVIPVAESDDFKHGFVHAAYLYAVLIEW